MRVAFFGDSFVNGFGDPHYQGWVGRICESARARGDDITAYNCGIRRATSDDIKTSWLAEAAARLPREFKCAVVFSFGANDRRVEQGVPRVPLARQMDNTRAVLTAASQRWPVLFVASPRALDEGPEESNQVLSRTRRLEELCNSLGVAFLDTCAASMRFTRWHTEAKAGDGVHPGAGGYAEFAAVVDAWAPWRALLAELRD